MADLIGLAQGQSAWAGRRVLLTGHTGFKGSWLAIWLQWLGAHVTGLSLAAEAGSLGALVSIETRIPTCTIDIRNRAETARVIQDAQPEIVFHLAAQALVWQSYADPMTTFETNVIGTANVLEAVRSTPSVRAVVIVTTDKCYENREWAWPYRESDALGGHDPYSASKACAELVTASWRRSFLQENRVAVASARAGNVIGGGDWSTARLVPDCIRAFLAEQSVRIRNPAATRPWQYVLDPLGGYLLLAQALLRGDDVRKAWNFGPSVDNIGTVGEVVGRLVQAWGHGASWSADPGQHPHEAGLLAVDASMARHELGWRPRLSLNEAIDRTVDWYKRKSAGEDAFGLVASQIENYVEEFV